MLWKELGKVKKIFFKLGLFLWEKNSIIKINSFKYNGYILIHLEK